jgi:dihydrofolate reductase
MQPVGPRLRYTAITSLDGYVADRDGRFDWSAPDEEVHAFVNEMESEVGTYLYGRRLYEVMRSWQDVTDAESEAVRAYAEIWRAADKVVWSRTLTEVTTPRTRLEREYDPAAVRALVEAADSDVSIGGPTLAARALVSGQVDDLHVLVSPVVVGGGTQWLPDDLRLDLALVDEHRFGNGVVHLHYRT